MTDVVYVQLDREQAIQNLGSHWPVPADATVLRCPAPGGVTDGAVVIYERPGRPGVTWWLVDNIIPPQGAGTPDAHLASLIPESELIVPEPVEDPLPPDQDGLSATDTPSDRPSGPNPGTRKE